MISILPNGDQLQADLYATSKEIGFVKVGDEVNLRYEAFPFQMYGVHTGHVALISRTALTSAELSGIGELLAQRGEAADRGNFCIASPSRWTLQTVSVNGALQPLQVGMLLEGDVVQETRRLYEWVFEPLYAFVQTPTHKPQ